jgi:hypothetical protein
MPLGSLVSGYLATSLGAPTVIAINGVLLVVVAGYFCWSTATASGRLRQLGIA